MGSHMTRWPALHSAYECDARTVSESAPTVATWRVNDGVCESLNLPSDAPDCDGDLIADACGIALGLALDANTNAIPDECEP
ncbi:MAG: hypothetical protein CMJ89_09075 [Planctomycetes bacterium]|nr:hypothetical protein [Planctomycetota bacterium]